MIRLDCLPRLFQHLFCFLLEFHSYFLLLILLNTLMRYFLFFYLLMLILMPLPLPALPALSNYSSLPSSLLLFAAASIAFSIIGLIPDFSKTFNPAVVVPCGEATLLMRLSGFSPVSLSSLAVPNKVCNASL